jgi:putative transposase
MAMRELTELGDDARRRALERFCLLRPHVEGGLPLAAVARSAGIPLRTAQRWLSRYNDGGLRALGRGVREDLGKRPGISPALIEFVEGLALSRPLLPVSAIYRETLQVATDRGESSPSEDTVWRIVRSISPGLAALAHDGAKRYGDRFDIVLRREAGAPTSGAAVHLWITCSTRLSNSRANTLNWAWIPAGSTYEVGASVTRCSGAQ